MKSSHHAHIYISFFINTLSPTILRWRKFIENISNLNMCSDSGKKIMETQPGVIPRYICLSILVGVFAVWHKYTFIVEEEGVPSLDFPLHSFHIPLFLTVTYLVSLPILNKFVSNYLAPRYDMKALLFESMVFYNVAQVCMNVWMVWRFINAVLNRGHPFIGSVDAASAGTTFAIWVHYTNKYLEFLDTYFMVLRGKMEQVSVVFFVWHLKYFSLVPHLWQTSSKFQVSFLHVYHHTTIAWAWWAGLHLMPGGDSYFGALLNSMIHVMMYSYYCLALFKISCPWKRYLTQAQLAQFTIVVIYSFICITMWGEKRDWKGVSCIFIQVGEMTSLFVLFARFYKKSYKKKSRNGKKEEDECSKAMGAISNSATEGLRSAAKETNKIVSKANSIVTGASSSTTKCM